MLLEEFKKDSSKKFRRMNKVLSERYGMTISSKASYSELEHARNDIFEQVQQLKINGSVSKDCPELSKNLLVLECVETLIEHKRLDELRQDFMTSGPYRRVIEWLSDFAAKSIELGDDAEDAVEQAMKEFRSSKWRFPDEVVRYDTKVAAMNKAGVNEQVYTAESIEECPMSGHELSSLMEPDEVENVKAFIIIPGTDLDPAVRGKLHDFYQGQGQAPDEESGDNWYGDRVVNDFPDQIRGEMDEASWDDLLDKTGRAKMPGKGADKYLDGSTLSMAPPAADDGRETTQADHRARRNKISPKRKTEMREDFVKQLRALLESEVDEAEIIIAVKGIGKTIQEMIEKIGRLQNEDLPPLSDQVRDTYGPNIASNFQDSTNMALQSVMDSLYQSKDEVDQTVLKMASGAGDLAAEVDMDMPIDGMDAELDVDADLGLGGDIDAELDAELAGDDFEGDAAASGPLDEPLGRAKKLESVEAMQTKIAEMKKLLASAKALQETA